MLKQLFGVLPDRLLLQVPGLCLEQIENLGEALLGFSIVADLERWLEQNFKIRLQNDKIAKQYIDFAG